MSKMENSLVPQFSYSFKEILVDEIALEGLEGVGFDLLWRLIEKRLSSPITEKMKSRYWGFIIYCDAISLYEIPEPLSYVEIKDRFELVDEESGNLLDPPDSIDGPYEYCPAATDHGSSIHYSTRKKVTKSSLKEITFEKVVGLYGDKLVMVASLEERWKALAPHMPINCLKEMTKTHYCLLELIGKSRGNGQMTVGNSNVTKILKEPKILFYNRKNLQDLDLIRVQALPQMTAGRSVKGLLMRLKRFHQPLLLSMPKKGKLYDVTQYLLKQVNYTETCKKVVDSKVIPSSLLKKLYKCENAFVFESIPMTFEKRIKHMSDKTISLNPPSEESSQSEDETPNETLKCQYHVKVNLLRQAYERILGAGRNGLSQVELSQIIGLEYYTARTICRTLKAKNIVKEIFVDKGKQREARFVASASAAAVDHKYEAEKKKFLEFLDDSKNPITTETTSVSELEQNENAAQTTPDFDDNDSDSDIPKKKPKLSKLKPNEEIVPDSKTMSKIVTEVKHLDGLENVETQRFLGPGKAPTMRQLKFANGILKSIRRKVIIMGYMNLNTLAAKESNEPLMDSKCLKTIVQKLVTEGQIKLLKMTAPMWRKSCILLCAPHVKATDTIVKTKYKEISLSMIRNHKKEEKVKKATKDPDSTRPLALSLYPRYLKLQKLHESLIKIVYFNEDENYHTLLPKGFSSLVEMIPEFTVEFVIGNMSSVALSAMTHSNIPQNLMQQKLRDVPSELFKTFLATPALQNNWRLSLKVLSTLGLIQLIKNPSVSDENFILSYEFYVNRRASIIDTTGDWPRDNADKLALQRFYQFDTFADVEQYWKDVYEISTKTSIKIESRKRCHRHPIYTPRLRDEVHEQDNGQVLGNGQGPCGFDSSLYMDMPKLWAMSHTKLKHALLKKPLMQTPKRRKPGKPRQPKVAAKKKKCVVKPPPDQKKTRNRLPGTYIPQWSREDDKIIMLCKAAITIISPVALSGCLRLRNLVAKDILTLIDPKKSGAACHKRATTLDTNTILEYEKDCLINEMRRYPHILRRYEGIFKTLRLQYCGNITKVVMSARVPMLELVFMLMQLYRSESFNKTVPCVAVNLEDFQRKFTMCPSTVNRNYNSYKTPVEAGPMLAAIKEVIIIVLISSCRMSQRPETTRAIHGMLSGYPEQTLRPAIEQLRKSGAVAAKEKTLCNTMHKYHLQDVAQSSYKIATSYRRRWICRMNAEFADNLMFILDDEIPKNDLKGTPEINCLIFESQACDILDAVCEKPPAITGVGGVVIPDEHQLSVADMLSYSLKPGVVGWRSKKTIDKFSESFQDMDYETALENLLRESQLTQLPDNIDTEDKIVSHLKTKNRLGATLEELQKATGYDMKTLTTKIKTLESEDVVKRLGYFENVIVLMKFAKHWTVAVKDKRIIPTPWITLDIDIRNDVFLKWAGIIVDKIFLNPGCSIAYIADKCEYLTTRAAQDICMTLEKCKCITLKTVNVSEPDLFSEDVFPECEEFNPYASVDNILAFPRTDMLTRYAHLRKKMFDDEYYFENT